MTNLYGNNRNKILKVEDRPELKKAYPKAEIGFNMKKKDILKQKNFDKKLKLQEKKNSRNKAPKPKRFAGGGMTTKGLGRAFMKGGKV
tara:strand:- start:1529 stop:1792 length:264 start_codon:yes stop_codon:yes gene_type:complete